jgi:hypothetical protein
MFEGRWREMFKILYAEPNAFYRTAAEPVNGIAFEERQPV